MDASIWQYVFYGVGSLAALRALFLMSRFTRFMDDIEYRDVKRFQRENDKRFGG